MNQSPLRILARHGRPAEWAALIVLLLMPALAGDFVLVQILCRTLILGLIALGLTFLIGFAGIVSLAQMTIAGVAAYGVAILTTSDAGLTWSLPFILAIPAALLLAMAAAVLIGWLAVRTSGIYTIMITLAIAVVFFYFTRQNYAVFNGFTGFPQVLPPTVFGVNWGDPTPFYWLCLLPALLGYWLVRHLVLTPFGLALQGMRDGERRLAALGFNVHQHRIAAYAVAGFLAAMGGVLLVWFNTRIDPSTVGVQPVINILVIAVIGGVGHPVGAFVGALVFVLIDNFATDLIPGARERFNLLIGVVFLSIVVFSSDGLLGLWQRFARSVRDTEPD
ncbi:branched-chain amino acid ABC transporter permease [Ectothiorhodospiraceae bacterium WFHF3C12]|nr:branched-chain amino acid ABC transporter permease [Ectothiorhodospiraceae bacterium WFHF3C12]